MNDTEYFERLAAFVSYKMGTKKGSLTKVAKDLHPKFRGEFSTTYNFLMNVRKGHGLSLLQGPVEARTSLLLTYFGVEEGDQIITDSKEYFGDRFFTGNGDISFKVSGNEREVMRSLVEDKIYGANSLPLNNEVISICKGLVRRLNGNSNE